MGGHGALIMTLKNPGMFSSVSAFAPISHPMECPWGHKCFGGYLGEDKDTWKVIRRGKGKERGRLTDKKTDGESPFYFFIT